MKPKIKIFDSAFAHTPNGSFGCGNLNLPPTFFDWDRSDKKTGDLCIVSESSWWTIDSINYPIRSMPHFNAIASKCDIRHEFSTSI